MNRINGTLRIELKSDLCIASGYSYAQIVDTDVCYDKYGLPYIPSRRLKGCLREAAELIRIDTKDIDDIFGKTCDDNLKGVIIGDALVYNVDEIESCIRNISKGQSEFNEYITPQKILEYYTDVRAQTAIDRINGVAKGESLRFTRVVNQNLPEQAENLVFVSEVEIPEDQADNFEKIVKALRHIGFNRNRGLGNVKCELQRSKSNNKTKYVGQSAGGNSEKYGAVDLLIENCQPLMLSQKDANVTEEYIRGQVLLGVFAGMYLEKNGQNSATEDEFIELFLKENIIFENALPHEGKIDKEYEPVPGYIKRLKKTKACINALAKDTKEKRNADDPYLIDSDENNGEGFNRASGNLPKNVEGFVAFDGMRNIEIINPAKEIIYHHSKAQDTLYTQKVLGKGQKFKARIIGKKEHLNIILELLQNRNNTLRIGKSKTAQYGQCRIKEIKQSDYNVQKEIKKGDTVVVSFVSDGLFAGEKGYTVTPSEVAEIIANHLGIENYNIADIYVKKDVLNGYNAKWNLKKLSYPVIMHGSYFVFEVLQDTVIHTEYIGEKNGEGLGRIAVRKISELSYELQERKDETSNTKETMKIGCDEPLYLILMASLKNEIKKELANKATEIRLPFIQNNEKASLLGRITLMLKESTANNSDDSSTALNDYIERLESIKSDRSKDISKEIKKILSIEADNKIAFEKVVQDIPSYTTLKKLTGEKEADKIVKDMWPFYMEKILTHVKYSLKKEVE